MSVDLFRIHGPEAEKSRDQRLAPALSWLVARIKLMSGQPPSAVRPGEARQLPLRSASFTKARPSLRSSSRPHRQVPELSQDARHLHPVQLRHERQNLRNKLVFHQFADFVLAALFSATEQFRHGHLQGSRQPFQGRQRRRGFLVFNLGNVSPRYGHASRELPLAQPAPQAQRADRCCQVQVPSAVAGHGHHHRWYHHHRLGLGFFVQGRVAASAIIIDRTELNQQAMIATDDFPRVYWGKSRGHRVVGVPEPATPYFWNLNCEERFRPKRQSAVQGLWMSRLKYMKPCIWPAKTGTTRRNPVLHRAKA